MIPESISSKAVYDILDRDVIFKSSLTGRFNKGRIFAISRKYATIKYRNDVIINVSWEDINVLESSYGNNVSRRKESVFG